MIYLRKERPIWLDINTQVENIHTFYTSVKNFSDTNFDQQEINLLNKGLKFNPIINNNKFNIKNLELLAAESETVLQSLNIENKESVRDEIKNLLRNQKTNFSHHNNIPNGNFDHKLIKSIQQKLKNNNLILSKADKGNCIVIMNRSDYDEKVLKFISDNNIEKSNVKLNPFINKVKNSLKNSTHLLDKPKLLSLNPDFSLIPRLYGLLKIHKSNNFEEMPIRPVVAFNNSPTYNLAKYLNSFLKDIYKDYFTHTVLNNVDLANKIKDIYVDNSYMLVSFDVSNLFTNIPRNEVVDLIKEKIVLDNNFTDEQVIELLNLLNICLEQNFFSFNGDIYCQNEGLAMGSPLSPILADIFMHNFETSFIVNNPIFKNFLIYYYRYVDDILILWSGNLQDLHEFASHLNTLHSTIKFTIELENENKQLNFLDLTISVTDNKHTFDIFRKPTDTGVVIDNQSNHPYQHKVAAFHCYIERILKIPLSTESFNRELMIIKQIASNHNFQHNLINKILTKKRNRITSNLTYINNPLPNTIANNNKKYFPLTYIGPVSYRIANIFNNHCNIAFKTSNSLNKYLVHNKDKIPLLDKCGVYKLNCNDCNSIYVGRTFRNFKTRLKEHLRCFRLQTGFSQFAEHLLDENHTFNENTGFEVLHLANKGGLLNNLESLEILRYIKSNTVNSLNSQVTSDSTSTFSVLL